MKIVQIDGIRGLITAVFIGVCLFAGFVVFPGYAAMYLWNTYLVNLLMFPVLNLLQGVLLWGIVAITYCILAKQNFAVSFKESKELSDAELDSIIQKAKISSNMRMMNKVISKSDKFELNNKDLLKKSTSEKDSSLVSSPISLNPKNESEKSEEDNVSNVK